jgi:tetratricopeptide (TPR) repeat protein
MRSRLEIFCDRLLEACWLAALILVPLFFNPDSVRIFEQDKIILLRSLALLMSAVWLVRFLEVGGEDHEGSLLQRIRALLAANPLALPALLLVVINITATIISVAPLISLFGSYNRVQGLYVILSYFVIFFVAASSLRSRAQFERAVDVIILVSLPIALYGMMQRYGLDPLEWSAEVRGRVTGQLGNPIFLAAYLIMVVPLTLARGIQRLKRAGTGGIPLTSGALWTAAVLIAAALVGLGLWKFEAFGIAAVVLLGGGLFLVAQRSPVVRLLPLVGYAVILAAQLLAICFTQSRGPWLGLMGGLFAFAVLWALVHGARRAVLAMNAAGFAVMLLGLMLFLMAPSFLSELLKASPCVARFAEVQQEIEAGKALNLRELIWKGTFQLVTSPPPIWSPLAGYDPLQGVRPLIGYGPEAMGLIYFQVQPLELSRALNYRGPRWDRAHNDTYDVWVSTGLVGVGVYLLLITLIFYYALRWLGLIGHSVERRAFWVMWLGGGFMASVALGVWRGWQLVGLALPMGMLAGFFLYLSWRAMRSGGLEGEVSERALWIVALLSAVVAHWIELQFGIALVATRTYFWFYAALLVALGTRSLLEKRDERSTSGWPFWAVIATALVIPLGFEFISSGRGVLDAIIRSLFYHDGSPSLTVIFLLTSTWLVVGIIGLGRLVAPYVILSLGGIIGYWVIHTSLLVSGESPASPLATLTLFWGWVLLLVVGLVALLRSEGQTSKLPLLRQPLNALVIPLLLAALSVAVLVTNLNAARADVLYKQAYLAYRVGDWERSIDLAKRAISLRPNLDQYSLLPAMAYEIMGRMTDDHNQREEMFRRSEQALLRGQRLNPFNLDHLARLARLHWGWGRLSPDPAHKRAHLLRAASYFQVAARLHPTHIPFYNAEAQVYYELGQWQRAIQAYERALRLDPEGYEAQKDLALLLLQLGRYREAEPALEAALALAPQEEQGIYQALQRAIAYQRAGELEQALQEAKRALRLAPDSEKPLIQAYISQLQQ